MTRKTKAERLALPKDPSAYTALGGKTRHYKIKATGQEVSRRMYLTATRGYKSNEEYTRLPQEVKKAPSRGGRGKFARKKRVGRRGKTKGEEYGFSYVRITNYDKFKYTQFIDFLDALNLQNIKEDWRLAIGLTLKGNGSLSTRSGLVMLAGKMYFRNSNLEEVPMIVELGGLESLIDSMFQGAFDPLLLYRIEARYAYPPKTSKER